MGYYQMKTKRGYDFFEVASSMQKAIRRDDVKLGGYFALELYESNYREYVWKRLLTVSAEDCAGIVTQEIWSLYESSKLEKNKGRAGVVFVAKAVVLLCKARKCRDADHLVNIVYDDEGVDMEEIERYFSDNEKEEIPDYAYDVHTLKGKRRGLTKKDFLKTEYVNLKPRQVGLFDDLVENL